MDDRRASPRQRLRCEIQCENGSHAFAAEALDLSETGVAFSTEAQVHVGDTLTLSYRPSDVDPLMVVRVQVQNVSGARVGTRFLAAHEAGLSATH